MKKYYLTLLFALFIAHISIADNSYINDQSCASCHQAEYHQWQNSHHALAMQEANSKTVLADFNNFKFNYAEHIIIFYIKNNNYFIKLTGPDGKTQNYQVVYTFGIDPLQQYLVQFPNGKLQAFPIAWDTHQKKWFHLDPADNMEPENSLYWGKRYFNWNFSCADCHSTHINKNYNELTNSYHTTWSAINVGCQACHGPGQNHLIWAQAKLKGKTTNIANKGLINNYSTMNNKQYVESCAFCHSRRHPIIDLPITGTPLLDNYVPAILRENTYYADGSIEDEDYEYGSFIQSKMYKKGVICSDCHNPHTALVKINNNTLCTQCHNAKPPLQRFPTLIAKNYDSPEHTHHPVNSLASECVSCHMSSRTYMNIDVRRDHFFRIPRPDLTIKYGIPNACNACHRDKSPQWAQQAIEKWYGKINTNDDYADIITAGRNLKPQAENQLIKLSSDNSQSSIVRATVAYLLHDYHSAESVQTLINLTKSDDALVRTNAVNSLDNLPNDQKITVFIPLLNDPIRAVRIEAAKSLATVPSNLLNAKQQQLFNKILIEYKNSQQAAIDTAEANLNLAQLAQAQHDNNSAEKYYLKSLQLDANFFPASQNLAMLYNSEGKNDKAEKILREGIKHNKDQGELYYSLGLLLAEENNIAESAAALKTASQLMPNYPKVFYNYGLVLQHANRYQDAEIALLKAYDLNPSDPKTLYALHILYQQTQQWDKAQNIANELRNNFPESQQMNN